MSFSTFQIYLRAFFPRVPLWHWAVMGVVALALTAVLIGRKRFSVYGAIVLGWRFSRGCTCWMRWHWSESTANGWNTPAST